MEKEGSGLHFHGNGPVRMDAAKFCRVGAFFDAKYFPVVDFSAGSLAFGGADQR